MRQTGSVPGNEVFTSWKEIASYLRKGVRTVQRWEAQFGLPVRRPLEKAKGVVQATREDLDRWLASNWAVRAQDSEYKAGEGFRTVTMVESSSIERAHALRTSNRKLISELEESLERLRAECEMLNANLQVHGKLEILPKETESPEMHLEKGIATQV